MVESITVSHAKTCPVSRPDFQLQTLPNGEIDPSAPNQCSCDFGARLALVLTQDIDSDSICE